MYGSPLTVTGGHAIRHHMSVRIEIVRIGGDKDPATKEYITSKVKMTAVKNKTAPPYRVANAVISYGYGFDMTAGLLDAALKAKVIKKKGSWFNFGDGPIAQGRVPSIDKLKNDDELRAKVETALAAAKEKAEEAEEIEDDESEEEVTRSPVKKPKGSRKSRKSRKVSMGKEEEAEVEDV
jgi:recombination protein RecA